MDKPVLESESAGLKLALDIAVKRANRFFKNGEPAAYKGASDIVSALRKELNKTRIKEVQEFTASLNSEVTS